jgi:hypothetical protein
MVAIVLCGAAVVVSLLLVTLDHSAQHAPKALVARTPVARAARRPAPVRRAAVRLTVAERSIPRVNDRRIVTRGRMPVVMRGNARVRLVDLAIQRAIVEDEKDFVGLVKLRRAEAPTARGVYGAMSRQAFISANETVVSFLIPVVKVVPRLHVRATWLAATVETSSGRRVLLRELFRERDAGLKALAAAVRRRLLRTNACVRASFRRSPRLAKALAPRLASFRLFALLPKGAEMAFPAKAIGSPSCGRVEVEVPYRLLLPYLSGYGARMISAVRAERR